ncbi:MAG TPA: hypothetical protein IAD13_00915 [Bacteroidetes bacterium]|nr:hypothetical protein [Candidatus Limimorpha avicola]
MTKFDNAFLFAYPIGSPARRIKRHILLKLLLKTILSSRGNNSNEPVFAHPKYGMSKSYERQ